MHGGRGHLELVHGGRADDGGRHIPATLAPRQRQLRGRQTVPLGHLGVLSNRLAGQRLVVTAASRDGAHL